MRYVYKLKLASKEYYEQKKATHRPVGSIHIATRDSPTTRPKEGRTQGNYPSPLLDTPLYIPHISPQTRGMSLGLVGWPP